MDFYTFCAFAFLCFAVSRWVRSYVFTEMSPYKPKCLCRKYAFCTGLVTNIILWALLCGIDQLIRVGVVEF